MSDMRVGHGFDVHRLVKGRPLIIGGTAIDFELGLDGHSDADVLLHAIADALLGAAALPDIGQHFPPSDPAFKDADSAELLRSVTKLVADAGYTRIHNVDATIMAQQPAMNPHIGAMRTRIAGILGISPGCVGIKATTTEGLGFVGRGEGIAAAAVCLIGTDV